MSSPHFSHPTLQANLTGEIASSSPPVVRYRNIKYAHIPARFTKAEPINNWNNASLDCTTAGPRCPQISVNLSSIFRIPKETPVQWTAAEDEFDCLNLDVTLPAETKPDAALPVMVWIHGGSLIVQVGNVESKTADPVRLVASSVNLNKPIILVSLNYRLNFFGLLSPSRNSSSGLSTADANLAQQDQRLALHWVKKHIQGFGGSPNNVTLFGESAGAVSTHMHVLASTSESERNLFRRAILMSGSTYTIPAVPPAEGEANTVELCKQLQIDPDAENAIKQLRNVTKQDLARAQEELMISTGFPVDDNNFLGAPWHEIHDRVPANVEALMLGDTIWESIIWNESVSNLATTDEVLAVFPHKFEATKRVLDSYGLHPELPVKEARKVLLDFIGDAKFCYNSQAIAKQWKEKGKKVYWYVLDEPNPLEPKTPAHHNVDLLFLFGTYEMGDHGEKVGDAMKEAWIRFAHAEDPWQAGCVMAFGPGGVSREIEQSELGRRRRVKQFEVLEDMGYEEWRKVASHVTGKVKSSLRAGY